MERQRQTKKEVEKGRERQRQRERQKDRESQRQGDWSRGRDRQKEGECACVRRIFFSNISLTLFYTCSVLTHTDSLCHASSLCYTTFSVFVFCISFLQAGFSSFSRFPLKKKMHTLTHIIFFIPLLTTHTMFCFFTSWAPLQLLMEDRIPEAK